MNNLALIPPAILPINQALRNLAIGVFLALVMFLLLRAVTTSPAGSAVQPSVTIKSSGTTTVTIELGPGFPEYWQRD